MLSPSPSSSFGSVARAVAQAPAQPAASGYLLPPKAIVDILDAPPPPTVELSPTRDVVALLERASMPTIAQLSQPMHRLAGVRINPRTNGPHRAQLSRAITLKSIADGSERQVTLPPNPMLSWIGFSPDGKRFAFTQQRDNGIELWIGDSATGQAKSVTPAQLNASLGTPCEWVGDGGSLLCEFVVAQPRRRADDGRADRSQHPGTSRRHRARPHLSGSADQRA